LLADQPRHFEHVLDLIAEQCIVEVVVKIFFLVIHADDDKAIAAGTLLEGPCCRFAVMAVKGKDDRPAAVCHVVGRRIDQKVAAVAFAFDFDLLAGKEFGLHRVVGRVGLRNAEQSDRHHWDCSTRFNSTQHSAPPVDDK
jgi:hypothetical protein